MDPSLPELPTKSPDGIPPRHWLSWRAALFGGAVAIAASAFFGTLVANVTLWYLTLRGLPLQEAYSALFESTEQIVIGQAVGFLCNAGGGYAAASMASRRVVLHSMLAGAASLVFVAVAYATPTAGSHPMWMVVWNFLLPLPAAILGGFLRARRA